MKPLVNIPGYTRPDKVPAGGVKYDIVHMRDQAFSKQPLNEFGSLLKKTPKQVLAQF